MKTMIKILIGIGILLLFINTVNAIDIECSYDYSTYKLEKIKANNGNIKLYTGESINIPKKIIDDVEKENTDGKDTGSRKEYVGKFKTKHTTEIFIKTKNKLVKKGKYVFTMSKSDFKYFKKYVLKKHKFYQSCPNSLLKFANRGKIYDEDTDSFFYYINFKNVKFKVKILKKVKTKELYQMCYGDSRDYRTADGYKFVLSVKKYKPVDIYKKTPVYGRMTVNNVNSGGITKHYNYLDFIYYQNGKERILDYF